MTHLHVTLSAHLDLRVEVVVPVSHPRVSSTCASELDQRNETGSQKNRRNRPQLTVAAPLLSASTQYLFRLLPLLSPSPFGREARGHRHRVISPSASAAAVLRPLSFLRATAEGRPRRRRAARERRRLRRSRPAISCPSSRDIAGHRDAKGKQNSMVLEPEAGCCRAAEKHRVLLFSASTGSSKTTYTYRPEWRRTG